MGKVERNQPCHCGSGLKYKKCCESKKNRISATVLQPSQELPSTSGIARVFHSFFVSKAGAETVSAAASGDAVAGS